MGMFWRAVSHRPLPLLADVALALVQGLLMGVAIATLGNLVNRRDFAALMLWGGALLLSGLCGALRPLLSRRAQQGIREALGGELLEAAVHLPLEDFERPDVLTRLERAAGVMGGDRVYQMLQVGLNLLTEGSRMVAMAAVMPHRRST